MLNRSIKILVFAALIASCNGVSDFEVEPQNPTLFLDFEIVRDGKTVDLDEPFIDQEGLSVNLIALKFFISNIELVTSDDKRILLSEAEFIDFEPQSANLNSIQWGKAPYFYVPEGNFKSISFGLGLPADLNSGDPTDYANENPLSTYTFMHWSWATKYRFVVLEAKVDTNGGDVRDHDVIFHTGLDTLYRPQLNFETSLDLQSFDVDTIHFQIDWDELFYNNNEPFNLKNYSVTHTADNAEEFDMALKFTDNFWSALKIQD